MSVSFDWNFDDEAGTQRRPGKGGRFSRRRRRWLGILASAAVLFAVVGLGARAWIAGRLKAVERAEAELRAVVELELKTIAEGDAALFASLQDPSDVAWRTRQIERFFSADAASYAPAPGLIRSDRAAEIKRIQLSGAGFRVELIRWFRDAIEAPALPIPDGDLPFLTTWFYRRAEDANWRHVAPPEDYPGIPYSWHGSRLAIYATETEAEQIDPIADDLARLVAQACRWLDCPAGARYTLQFLDVIEPQAQGDWWALPALHMTGLPENQAARTAWRRALMRWTVESVARALVDDERVTQQVIFRQLVQRLQNELGVADAIRPDAELLAQAMHQRRMHPVWRLWRAKADPSDSEETRLYEAEVAAFLQFLENEVGAHRLFRLIPALSAHPRMYDALSALYDLDHIGLDLGWQAYLTDLTGVALSLEPQVSADQPLDQRLEPPSLPPPPLVSPGDQIAFICDGRIWVGNADGSAVVPLTSADQQFAGLSWSPDGRWLLTAWEPATRYRTSALYLLAADGSEGRLLTDDPLFRSPPLGWSPDGDVLYYASRFDAPISQSGIAVAALRLATGETRELPGVPVWSLDGQHLVYFDVSTGGVGTAWLADADWENAAPIAEGVLFSPKGLWSPNSARFALVLSDDDKNVDAAEGSSVAVFDVTTAQLTASMTAADVNARLLQPVPTGSIVDYVSDGTDPSLLVDRPLVWLWLLGWSADSQRILAGAGGTGQSGTAPVALVTFSPDALVTPSAGKSPSFAAQVLAYGIGTFIDAAWSPTDRDRLVFSWLPAGYAGGVAQAYIVDLGVESVYPVRQGASATWAPDGRWLAFPGRGQVAITDRDGQERYSILVPEADSCSEAVWNPVADLWGLGEGSQ